MSEQWHVIVPLAPTQDEWVEQFAAAIREVDPDVDADRAQAAMRWAMRVPRPRDGRDDFEPTPQDWFDPGHEGADLAELRESRWREWEA